MKMTASKYCSDYDAELEASIDETLGKIRSEVALSPIAPHLDYLVLGGGYGRGEGGILREDGQKPRLYNDLDFFVFSKTSNTDICAQIDKFFETMSRSWSAKLGVDVDFSKARPVSYAAKRLNMLMWHEMSLGCKIVYGDTEKFEKIFPVNPDRHIPPSEISKLLMNRFSGLMLAEEKLRNSDKDFDFICRNINKAVLACADSILYMTGRLKYRTSDKLAQIETLGPNDFPQIARFKDVYRQAVGFKKNPVVSYSPENLKTRLADARELSIETLSKFRKTFRTDFSTPVAKLRNLKKNCKVKEYFAAFGIDEELFDNPVNSALNILEKFLKHPDSATKENVENYLRIWKEIN